ncbi:MAG: tRNA epoxyqueuosine(34) reductase QueG [Deltaproteobacteria bacterium]|nr:tRNA epoxyqueuosine(34) reductase QueG [Deltaproteobacteria bacterium]
MPARIIQYAQELGFIKVGFARPTRPLYLDAFRSWLFNRKHADMTWLERHLEIRADPSLLLPGCRTIITLAYRYPSEKPCAPDGFTAARYSRPQQEDYHQDLKRLCRDLAAFVGGFHPGKTRICVDSAPMMERSFAVSSAIGFIGKNNMLIIPGVGSFFYLAEILTTASLDFSPVEPIENQCGSCEACIESCPTGALERPFLLNASKCLSYKTIEDKRPVDLEDAKRMGDCFWGCDRCQEVCPFNSGGDSRRIVLPPVHELFEMDQEAFDKRFGKTALARGGLEKLRTNISAVLGQSH